MEESPVNDQDRRLTEDEVKELRDKMKKLKMVKDRTYFFKKYPKCFVGSEAVTFFLTTHYCNTIPQSIALGQQLMDCDYLHHVSDDHPFKNEHLYYRWREDEDYFGPSVAKLLMRGTVTVHSDVDMKGLLFWNKKYVLLESEEKVIYLYSSNLSSDPSGIINLQQGVLETAECECKSGSYCFTLSDGKHQKWVLCAYNSKAQLAWLEALANIGVKFREEDFDPIAEASIFDFSANDIDGNLMSLDQYRGKVCIVVNVASY
jgi:hypothetical protein